MAIANLHETFLTYTQRLNDINLHLTVLSGQKRLATLSQADLSSLNSAGKSSVRAYFKQMFEESTELQAKYSDYTQITGFEEEIEKLDAQYQEELEELTYWEQTIDEQITTDSTEKEEITAYMESLKSTLSSNIQEDYGYGLGN